jgi:hypothetical protein
VADYELHADYDRNGRLDASSSEYGRRMLAPGAILVPNMDADGRALPASVIPGSPVVLDGKQPTAPATDDEQLPLRVLVRNASAAAGTRFFLRPVGFPRIRLRFNDAGGRMLPRDLARDADLPITPPSTPGTLDFRLSTKTLPGSPIGHVTNLNTKFSLNDDDESTFQVELISVDPTGTESHLDTAQFSIAPFVILDHSATAVRTYMAENGENEPSVTEMDLAHRAIGVPLLRVPTTVSTDSWLQDQFQHALIQGPDRWRQVIVHMPRLRKDTSNGTTAINLASFVLSHFPSRDVGVFNDLWDRAVQVFDTSRTQHRIPFLQCVTVAAEMKRAFHLLSRLVDSISVLDPAASIDIPDTWSGTMARIPDLVARFSRLAAAATGSEEWLARVEGTRVDLVARRNALLTRLPFNASRGVAGIPVGTTTIELTADAADRLYRRLQQMRDSSNYGGNLEASPPTANAPLGKLVIGNVTLRSAAGDEWDFMDPDLLRLLYKQAKQPIVQLNTTWLHVGHVDEVMTFAPDTANPGGGGFAVLQASPALAMRLLRGARDRFFAGLTSAERAHYETPPSGASLVRHTDLGTSPITRLHRGKLWIHRHEPRTGDELPDIQEPPQIYQRLSQYMSGSAATTTTPGGINIWGLRYWPGEGPPRTYPADITVPELLFAEKDDADVSTNDHIAASHMRSVEDSMRDGFPGPRTFPLPVLFDRVSSVANWTNNPFAFQTSGFTSNVVNLQIVNGRLLVPRPYGPRMRPDDAVAVITEAMAACGVPESVPRRIDARFIRRHRLATGIYWLRRAPPIVRNWGTPAPYSGAQLQSPLYDGLETVEEVIEQFRDSFPGATDAQLRTHIFTPNRRHFDARGELQPGWRRFEIADDMIDLFEASVLAVADELGAQVHWIDSWFYHTRIGEIHCGSNVLRVPARGSGLPNVWDVADLQYGAQTFDFTEGLDVTAPPSE